MKREGEVGPRPDVRGPRSAVHHESSFILFATNPVFCLIKLGASAASGRADIGHLTSDIGQIRAESPALKSQPARTSSLTLNSSSGRTVHSPNLNWPHPIRRTILTWW